MNQSSPSSSFYLYDIFKTTTSNKYSAIIEIAKDLKIELKNEFKDSFIKLYFDHPNSEFREDTDFLTTDLNLIDLLRAQNDKTLFHEMLSNHIKCAASVIKTSIEINVRDKIDSKSSSNSENECFENYELCIGIKYDIMKSTEPFNLSFIVYHEPKSKVEQPPQPLCALPA